MKRFSLYYYIVLVCMIAMFTDSCVQGDLYDDGTEIECIFRKKLSKDNMNYMNKLGKNYPPHVIAYFESTGCARRALQAKFGSNWINQTVNAINVALNYAEEHNNYDFLSHLINKYFTNGEIDEDKISSDFNTTSVLFHFGFSQQSNVAIGDLALTYTFDKWGGQSIRHVGFVTEKNDDSRMFSDSDGNQWSYDFIEYIFR